MKRFAIGAALLMWLGCGLPMGPPDDGGSTDSGNGGTSTDSGSSADSGPGPSDSGPGADAGAGDSGAANDAGPTDAGSSDAGGGSGQCVGSVPLTYDAPTDRLPHLATPPPLGDAGYVFTDPTYGTRILRLTDVNTVPGTNLSYRVANEFWGNDWSTDAKHFYIQDSSGGILPYDFSPTTLAASRVMALDGGYYKYPLNASGGFSRLSPNVAYGVKGLTVSKLDFTTQTVTSLLDLTTVVPGATGYDLGVEEGANGLIATSFGGPQQDKMPYVAIWDPTTGASHVVDTYNSTLDGQPIGATIDGGVHSIKIDHSGRYVTFGVAGGASANWIWDTAAGTVQSVPSAGSLGSGAWIRKTNGDSYAWALVDASSPSTNTNLITPLLSPTDNQASSSLSWSNAVEGALAPVIVETMRQPSDTGPRRAWDDELIAVRTDGVLTPGDGGVPETQVWRFAHTFNTYSGTIYSDNFYYLFIPRVSQNGQFVIFDSNWNQSLGTDSSGNPRTDVFIAELPNPCGP